MAPKPRARPAKKAAKKASKGKAPAKKPARRPSPKPARKPAATRRPAAARPKAKPAPPAAPMGPSHSERLAKLRAEAQAKRTPHNKAEERAEHDHQDPRLAGVDNLHAEQGKVGGRELNYGQIKNGSRYQNTVNWFRRAAHPKQ